MQRAHNFCCATLFYHSYFFSLFSAAITVRFRALTSTGLLFYVADSDISPSTWMSLYLENGHLMFNVQTNSMRSESIQSNYRYNDGQWWEATLLRLHNFMALVGIHA